MKNTFFSILFLLTLISFSNAQQQSAKPAQVGVQYGKAIDKKDAVSVRRLEQNLLKEDRFFGIVEGKVMQVCKSSGCFLTLQGDTSKEPIMVRFKDYAYIVPADLIGKTVVLEGEAKVREKEDKKTNQKIRSITVIADGVLVVK